MINKIFLISILILISGCNFDDSRSSSKSVKATGYLLDSKVSGVEYYCNNIQGITDKNGAFKFDYSCNYISFKIGSVTLAEMSTLNINKDKLFFITDITEQQSRADTNNTSVKNITRLLQTLDDDYNPENGINITKQTRDNISNTVNLNISNKNINEDDLKNIVIDAGLNRELVSPIKALVHFEQTLRDNNIHVDTVPPYLPFLSKNILATANDKTYIDINGEKNTKLYLNGIYTGYILDKDGIHDSLELDTSGLKNKFYDFDITIKDDANQTSEVLHISIFKDTDDISPYIFPKDINITSPNKEVIDLNITDNSEDYGLSLDYELSGLHASYFEVNSTNGKVSFKNDSVAGNTYQLTITVSDKSNHKRSGDLEVIVK